MPSFNTPNITEADLELFTRQFFDQLDSDWASMRKS